MTEMEPFHLQNPLLSSRLLLKALTVADAEALFQYRSLPEVALYQGWVPASLEDAARFIEEDISRVMNQPDTWFQFGIFLREEKTMIGDLGIHFLTEAGDAGNAKAGATGNAKDSDAGNAEDSDAGNAEANDCQRGEVEIGITVAPRFQGRGFATEAVECVLGFLFDTLHKSKVVASVDPLNQKSMTLMAGVGFQQEGIYKNTVLIRGVWADDAVFEMTTKQWHNRSKHRP